MIGNFVNNYESAIKFKEKIDELKVVEYSENIQKLYGCITKTFIYSNDEEKETHSKLMEVCGWNVVDGQSRASIYKSFGFRNEEKEDLYVVCGIYEKAIEPSMTI